MSYGSKLAWLGVLALIASLLFGVQSSRSSPNLGPVSGIFPDGGDDPPLPPRKGV
jgi:hypothetical protein